MPPELRSCHDKESLLSSYAIAISSPSCGFYSCLRLAALTLTSSDHRSLTHTFTPPLNPGYDTNAPIRDRLGFYGNEHHDRGRAPPAVPDNAFGRRPCHAAQTFARRAGWTTRLRRLRTHSYPKLVSSDDAPPGRDQHAQPHSHFEAAVIDRIPQVLHACAARRANGQRHGGSSSWQATGGGGVGPITLVEALIGMAGALISSRSSSDRTVSPSCRC